MTAIVGMDVSDVRFPTAAAGDGSITHETARWLALWMAFDDIVRVADLKSRASRFDRVRGEVKSKVIAICDRCLNEVVITIEAPFDLLYLPEDPAAGHSGETELHNRDLDLAVYENDQINLDDLVKKAEPLQST